MADAEQIDLIDFSSENDNLIFNLSSPPPDDKENHTPIKKFNMLGDVAAGKCISQDNDQSEPVPELVESEEPKGIRRNGKCNLRKSLAWDSAFFTSAGVLDPEELSSIMKGAKKAEKPLLPGIQEDISVSSDSISTLESDNFTLESVEVELFGDIRASIQKSCAVKNSGSITAFEAASNKALSSPKVDLNSANRPKPDMKKTTGLQTIGVPKCPPKMSTKMQGSGRAIKPEPACPQVPKSALRIPESTSSVPKPPKEISKVNSNVAATTKRASLSANRAKPDNDYAKTVTGRGAQVLKAPIPSGARRVLPKPSTSSRSSSLGPPTITKTQPMRSSKSDDSGSTSSSNGGKSPSATVGRKVATKTLNPPSSNSTAKTPSRSALRSKSTSKNSSVSAYLMSSKISSNISPASSISEWSSASSTSSVNLRSDKSRTSIGSSSSRSVEVDTPPLDMKTRSDKLSNGQDNRPIVLPDENMRRSSQTGTLSRSASMKPSGLKMPSPKIGFFDGAKLVRTPNGTAQPHSGLPVVLSKTGAGIGSKVGKLPAGRVPTAVEILKPETQKPNPPLPSQQKAEASIDLDVHDEEDVKSYSKPGADPQSNFGGQVSA